MKLLLETETQSVYEIPSFSSVTNTLLQDLFTSSSKKWLVFRPRFPQFDDLEILRQSLSHDFFSQFGFIARSSDIIVPTSEGCDDKLEVSPSINSTFLKEFIENSTQQFFFKKWESYLGEKICQQFKQSLQNELDSEKTLFVMREGMPVGAIYLSTMKDCLQQQVEQIRWLYADTTLDQSIRRRVHQLLWTWVKKRGDCTYQGGIHLLNIAAQKFCRKVGFDPRCVHITKK